MVRARVVRTQSHPVRGSRPVSQPSSRDLDNEGRPIFADAEDVMVPLHVRHVQVMVGLVVDEEERPLDPLVDDGCRELVLRTLLEWSGVA